MMHTKYEKRWPFARAQPCKLIVHLSNHKYGDIISFSARIKVGRSILNIGRKVIKINDMHGSEMQRIMYFIKIMTINCFLLSAWLAKSSVVKSSVAATWVTQFPSVIASDAIAWIMMTCRKRGKEAHKRGYRSQYSHPKKESS